MDEQQRKNKKLLLTIVGVAVVIVALVGTTYAFFNYTRTGGSNTVKTGRIYFNSAYTAINLSNAFPITSTQAETDTNNSRTINITVTGDTDYANGLEYLVTAEDVHMTTIGNRVVPLAVEVDVEEVATGESLIGLGELDNSYYTNRSTYASNHYNRYKKEYNGTLSEGGRLLVGYISPNETSGVAQGVNGVITIKVYFDANRIAITDTLEGTESTNETYTNGTTTSWVRGREVFTTTEWNALNSTGVSFKIKVESNEGIWVSNPGSAPMSLASSSGNITEGEDETVLITPNDNGTLSCLSSDTTKATCSISGTNLIIHGVSEGNATITVTQTAGSNYATASTATYTATIAPGTAAGYILANATLETTPYGHVYSGASVNNYVKFNCTDPSDSTTCEDWRILGVYTDAVNGDKLKIVRATPIASQTYNNSPSDGNVWGGSRLEQYLNQDTDGGYYYSLNADAKNMIAAGSWDVGACADSVAAATAYACATTTHTYSGVTHTTPLANKKVGLITTYEYLYAAENDGTCWTKAGSYGNFDTICATKDWLFSTLTSSGSSNAWTLSPSSAYASYALFVGYDGSVGNINVDGKLGASPVVYLKSGVTITGGKGQSGTPYTLAYSGS